MIRQWALNGPLKRAYTSRKQDRIVTSRFALITKASHRELQRNSCFKKSAAENFLVYIVTTSLASGPIQSLTSCYARVLHELVLFIGPRQWFPDFLVSISPMYYKEPFCYKSALHSFYVLTVFIGIFLEKRNCQKSCV